MRLVSDVILHLHKGQTFTESFSDPKTLLLLRNPDKEVGAYLYVHDTETLRALRDALTQMIAAREEDQ